MSHLSRRCFLFLQGPPGPFFAELAKGLLDAGHHCRRINFNGGDRLNWRGPALDFTGSLAAWPDYLNALIARDGVTDIVLFGDCRPLHLAARRCAASLGVVVHVFEEGYIRPDWITLERGGVNGHSSLPRNPDQYLALATNLPPVPARRPIPSSFLRRASEAFAYYFASWLLTPRFKEYRSHRPRGSAAETAGWIRHLLLRPIARLRSAIAMGQLSDRPYFILPLQLDSDYQIRTHSPFKGMNEAIERIVASFAANALGESVLIVKQHPLDNGLRPWRRLVRSVAARYDVRSRVLFIEHGDIQRLVVDSVGVVTVNSTTGTLALASGTPVAVLGRAVYDLPGITHQGDLDAFWTATGKPQLEIYEAFLRVLAARCLLRGGFCSVAGRAALIPAAVDRLNAWHMPVEADPPRRVAGAKP